MVEEDINLISFTENQCQVWAGKNHGSKNGAVAQTNFPFSE